MRNALGAIQSLLVLGGSSDIGAAIAERLVPGGCRSIVLAGRRPEAMEPVAERLRAAGAAVAVTSWDATDVAGHADAVKAAWAALPDPGPASTAGAGDAGTDTDGSDAAADSDVGGGSAGTGARPASGGGGGPLDVDCVLLAAGVLGDQEHLEDDPSAAADLAVANYAGPVSTLLHVTRRLEEQGHGTIIVLSSVAGERVRQSNFVYGSSKAALDGFCQGLGDSLEGTGVNVMVVRPGFVHSSMTEGKEAPPLSTTPEAVADAVVDGLASGKHTVWVPGTFRYVMSAFRHLPRPLWRKLSSRM